MPNPTTSQRPARDAEIGFGGGCVTYTTVTPAGRHARTTPGAWCEMGSDPTVSLRAPGTEERVPAFGTAMTGTRARTVLVANTGAALARLLTEAEALLIELAAADTGRHHGVGTSHSFRRHWPGRPRCIGSPTCSPSNWMNVVIHPIGLRPWPG